VSFADPRARHHGLSHHSATALTVATRCRALVPLPTVGGDEERELRADLHAAGLFERHEVVEVAPVGIVRLLRAHNLPVVSMGRPAADDPVLFEAAAAAGVVAASRIVAR
jgi:hypothetical protein